MAAAAGQEHQAHQRTGEQHREAHSESGRDVHVDRSNPIAQVKQDHRDQHHGGRNRHHQLHQLAEAAEGVRRVARIVQGRALGHEAEMGLFAGTDKPIRRSRLAKQVFRAILRVAKGESRDEHFPIGRRT